jgi:hypothetical protein
MVGIPCTAHAQLGYFGKEKKKNPWSQEIDRHFPFPFRTEEYVYAFPEQRTGTTKSNYIKNTCRSSCR